MVVVGLDLGFIKAGFEVVFANDIDKEACESYEKNIGKHILCKDIYTLDVKEIPNADILIGGFPCFGFTIAQEFKVVRLLGSIFSRKFYRLLSVVATN
ncbi:DNA cytosine methyltransferase [Campylobacter upsaliensis]|uniref:DNA cytosine methyltransferase n=1 Tax=Campylobacter upsaliensis TaxID=28080 RepID=UPI0022EA3D66|nr:DNA cytosine methyltransferase [Campylobacter upsaliensis]